MKALIQRALIDIMHFHKGQKDKAGQDYILHPIYVALQQENDEAKVIALLHDVLEDTCCTKEYLVVAYGKKIADSVEILTKKSDETYFDYIERIKTSNNRNCIAVKLADLEHNLRFDRIKTPTEQDYSRLIRYTKAQMILSK